MQAYCFALKNKTGITHEEFKSIFSKDGKEFMDSIYDFLIKKMHIDDSIRPSAYIVEDLGCKDFAMQYVPANNIIHVSRRVLNDGMSKSQVFGFLRHELQHFMQICDVLRCEGLSDKAVKNLVEKAVQNEKIVVDNLLQNNCVEQILAMQGFEQGLLLKLAEMKTNPKAYEDYFAELEKTIAEQYKTHRANIVKTMGTIKDSTKQAEKARIYFEELSGPGYYNVDSSLNVRKYYDALSEREAMLAGEYAQMESEGGGCFFKRLKQCAIQHLKKQS